MRRWHEVMAVWATYHEPGDEEPVNTDLRVGSVTFELLPMFLGSSVLSEPYSVVANIADGEGSEFYAQYGEDFKRVADSLRKPGHRTVAYLAVWACEAGKIYIPGEVDEYEEDAQFVGYLHPETFALVGLETADKAVEAARDGLRDPGWSAGAVADIRALK